jgi:hypothetical protein
VYLIANGLLPCVPGLEKFGLAEFLALGASLQFLEFWDPSAIIETKGLDCKINTKGLKCNQSKIEGLKKRKNNKKD